MKLTASQARNLEVLKAAGGKALFGPGWPSGLSQKALRGLVEKGLVGYDYRTGYWLK